MVATLADLAARGYLSVELVRAAHWWGGGQWTLHRGRAAHDLLPWERIVFESAFVRHADHATAAGTAWASMRKQLDPFTTAVQADLRRRGLWDPHAVDSRSHLVRSAWIWVASVAVFATACPLVWSATGPGVIALPGAALLMAALNGALAHSVPRHSPRAHHHIAAWEAFRAFVHRTGTTKKPPADATVFDRWLPLALGLDASKPWLAAAARWQAPLPVWFHGRHDVQASIGDLATMLTTALGAEAKGSGHEPQIVQQAARTRARRVIRG
jgi:hypothetical protein